MAAGRSAWLVTRMPFTVMLSANFTQSGFFIALLL